MKIALDKDGFYLGSGELKMGTIPNTANLIEENNPVPVAFLKAKWDGSKWVEGANESEIRTASNEENDLTVNAKLDLILELLQKKEE